MKLSASLYAADPLNLAREVAAVAPHVESLHVDVMDGRFAPGFGLGERLAARLGDETGLPFDVHLMVERPAGCAVRFARLGARRVAFHAGMPDEVARLAEEVRGAGSLAYLALRPETPIADVALLLKEVDGVLLLTAPAGGGAFDPSALARVRDLPPGLPSIVDGRIDETHFPVLRAAGVDLAVVGRSLFGAGDPARRAESLMRLAAADPQTRP